MSSGLATYIGKVTDTDKSVYNPNVAGSSLKGKCTVGAIDPAGAAEEAKVASKNILPKHPYRLT